MPKLYAQGDLLIEEVSNASPTGEIVMPASDGACVLAEGELTGHRHLLGGAATFYRDDGLARDIPGGLYLGHLQVTGAQAVVSHDEHAPITLEPGTYRVRRQRELEPRDERLVSD